MAFLRLVSQPAGRSTTHFGLLEAQSIQLQVEGGKIRSTPVVDCFLRLIFSWLLSATKSNIYKKYFHHIQESTIPETTLHYPSNFHVRAPFLFGKFLLGMCSLSRDASPRHPPSAEKLPLIMTSPLHGIRKPAITQSVSLLPYISVHLDLPLF